MFMRILNIPVYEHFPSKEYCYLFHDVAISMSKAALLLRESSRFEFVLHQPSCTPESLLKTSHPAEFKLTSMDSGSLSTVLLMLGKLRRWKKQSSARRDEVDSKFAGGREDRPPVSNDATMAYLKT